jgi:hypothetical protein
MIYFLILNKYPLSNLILYSFFLKGPAKVVYVSGLQNFDPSLVSVIGSN